MYLAYVEKLAKDKTAGKYLLVCQDSFDRTINAKGLKAKNYRETVRGFSTMMTKKINPREFGSTVEQKLLEGCKKKSAKLKK